MTTHRQEVLDALADDNYEQIELTQDQARKLFDLITIIELDNVATTLDEVTGNAQVSEEPQFLIIKVGVS